MGKRPLAALTGALLVTVLTACSSSKPPPADTAPSATIPALGGVVPVQEPPSRYGNPDSYEVFGQTYRVAATSEGYRERGIASWYGEKFHGKRTSSGTPYDMYALSAAHKSLPIPTYVQVTNLENGRQVVVRVDDRGPFVDGRIIDLSYTAAKKLGMTEKGTARVEVEALAPYQYLPGHEPAERMVAAVQPAPAPRSRLTDLPGVRSVVTTVVPAATAAATPVAAAPSSQPAAPPEQARLVPAALVQQSHPLYLQVGAFGERGNAERLQGRLSRDLGREVRIVQAREVFRVQVGPLENGREADRLALELSDQGLSTHRVYD